MTGSMWVESEVSKGSKFFFTITSQIGQLSMEAMLAKMAPFGNRNILFVDTLFDNTGVVDRIQELGLRPYVIHDPLEVADKATCPHIDTIVVDSLSVVRLRFTSRGQNASRRDRPRRSVNTSICGTYR